MPKINNKNTFPQDSTVSLNDFLIGTDADDNNKTRTYTLKSLLDIFNAVNGQQAPTSFVFSDGSGSTNSETEGYFTCDNSVVELGQVTTFSFNKTERFGKDLTVFFDALGAAKNHVVLKLYQPGNADILGYYRITAFQQVDEHYSFDVTVIGGFAEGVLVDGKTYAIGVDVGNLNALSDTDGDTKIEVEKNPDEDIVRITVGGVEVANIFSDRTVEFYQALLRNTIPNRIYDEEGWFRAEQDLVAMCFKDAANEFWVHAMHEVKEKIGDITPFYHQFRVRSRTEAATGRLNNPNYEQADGYKMALLYLPVNGEGDNYGLPDYMVVQFHTANTYMVIGSWGPTDYETGEKLGVYGGAFVQDILRVGKIKLTNPTEATTGTKALVYNEATDMVEVAQNTTLTTLAFSGVSYSSVQYRIKNNRLILIGSFMPTSNGSNVLLATLPVECRPNTERQVLILKESVLSNTQNLTIKTNGDLVAYSLSGGNPYIIDAEITLII